jgi:hypothetical protein
MTEDCLRRPLQTLALPAKRDLEGAHRCGMTGRARAPGCMRTRIGSKVILSAASISTFEPANPLRGHHLPARQRPSNSPTLALAMLISYGWSMITLANSRTAVPITSAVRPKYLS